MLRQGEQLIFQEPVKMLLLGTMVAGGTLYLTNTRLIYEKKDVTSLFGGSRVRTDLDCLLSDIRNISQGRANAQLSSFTKNILFIETNLNKSYEFAVQDPNWWYQAIKNTMDNYIRWTKRYDEQKAESDRERKEREARERREHELRLAQMSQTNINVSPNINVGKIGDDKIDVRDSVVMKSDLSTNRPPPPPPRQNHGGMTCSNCQSPIQDGWKVCPNCANPIDPGNKCGNCNADVQKDWKACPACGSSLGGTSARSPTCPHCGSEVQKGWLACPGCGNRI